MFSLQLPIPSSTTLTLLPVPSADWGDCDLRKALGAKAVYSSWFLAGVGVMGKSTSLHTLGVEQREAVGPSFHPVLQTKQSLVWERGSRHCPSAPIFSWTEGKGSSRSKLVWRRGGEWGGCSPVVGRRLGKAARQSLQPILLSGEEAEHSSIVSCQRVACATEVFHVSTGRSSSLKGHFSSGRNGMNFSMLLFSTGRVMITAATPSWLQQVSHMRKKGDKYRVGQGFRGMFKVSYF